MNVRSTRLGVEAMEVRDVPATLATGDINGDGRDDVAAITGATTITVSLANPDGGYSVSAVLAGPKRQTLVYVELVDLDGDGNLDVYALSTTNSGTYVDKWMGNGDGTFGAMTSEKYRSPFGHIGHGGLW
jgi:hypothetical protein